MPCHVSKARFAELVESALDELPEPFASHLDEIAIEIRDRPSTQQRREADLEDDDLLLGLYQGHPTTERSVLQDRVLPDVIYIFQREMELAVDGEQELIGEVRKTVLHEIGHHFGMSEEDLDNLGYG
jgi:predicted Zn-dependent protease with MMP-like domain